MLEFNEPVIHVWIFILGPFGSHNLCHREYGLSRVIPNGGVDVFEGQPITLQLRLKINLRLKLRQTIQIKPFLEVVDNELVQLLELVLPVVFDHFVYLVKRLLLLLLQILSSFKEVIIALLKLINHLLLH